MHSSSLLPLVLLLGSVVALAEEPVRPLPVGKPELELAREMLAQERSELTPQQWELLDARLREAERAWERLEEAKRASREVLEKGRGAEQGPALGLAAGSRAVAGVGLIPLLALLAAFSSSTTARPELDPPRWLGPQLEYEKRLQDLAEASKQVRLEVEASRGRLTGTDKGTPPAPSVREFEQAWVPVAGEPPWRPCDHKGTGGAATGSPAPTANWLLCVYQCGKYEVIFPIYSRHEDDCKKPRNLGRAEDLARAGHK